MCKYADLTGDSYQLSKLASEIKDARYIVFCGVHFMAETAGILSGPQQTVILPNMAAGCSMADMAPTEDVEDAWDDLTSILGGQDEIVPITYMNSTAEIKALCGRNGGHHLRPLLARDSDYAASGCGLVGRSARPALARRTAVKTAVNWSVA